MMELKDFESFLEFTKEQIKILKEKENNKYKDDPWKNWDEEDLLSSLIDQIDKYEWSDDDDKEYKMRRMLHAANIAFFLYYKLGKE